MSAPRQMLSALWAAVWLLGRLLGLSLRRLFGGGPKTAAAGPDFQMLGAGVAAEEAAREPVELPAEMLVRLEATRGELLRSARAASARRHARPRDGARRLRTASIAVAALLGLGVVGVGASALVAGSTGVPAVDRLLGIYETNLDKPGAADRPGPSGSDLQPSPTKASEPIEVTLGDGSRIVVSFYVAEDGRICSAIADVDGMNTGTLGCETAAGVVDRVRQYEGYVSGVEAQASNAIVRGFVSSRVDSLRGRGPDGPLSVQLGAPWVPALAGGEKLRPFVAVGPASSDRTSSDVPGLLNPQNYVFDARMEDGRSVRVAP